MTDTDTGRDAPRFRLFGTTIPVQSRQVKEGTSKSTVDTMERRPDKIIPCSRCKSMETKFCYFNNYNINQPRHFCKGCQRYWTAGGMLRNIPVRAGRWKTKPSCQGSNELFDNCLFDAPTVNQFELEGVMEQWRMATTTTTTRGGSQRIFPATRRNNSSAGQIC